MRQGSIFRRVGVSASSTQANARESIGEKPDVRWRVRTATASEPISITGAVEVERGHIHVRDVDALERIAEEER